MDFPNIPKAQDLFDHAITAARKEAGDVKRTRSDEMRVKRYEATKAKLISIELHEELMRLSKTLPEMDQLHPFYRDSLNEAISLEKLKKSLSHLSKIAKLIKRLGINTSKKIYSAKTSENAIKANREFFGRMGSLMRDVDKSLAVLNLVKREIRKIPQIKFEMHTLIFAGYPNVGKSTMLNALAGSNAKIASYPFTTLSVNLGYREFKYLPLQLIDCPGLLDRGLDKMNSVERRALAAIRNLNAQIVFLVDPTTTCGYSLPEQLALLERVRKEFSKHKIMVVATKADISSEPQINEVKNAIADLIVFSKNDNAEKLLEKLVPKLWFEQARKMKFGKE